MDDATACAKLICAASPNAGAFVLLPVVHGSTTQESVVMHRRIFEDLLFKLSGQITSSMLSE